MDGTEVIAEHKAPTSINVSSGIVTAIHTVLQRSGVAPDRIRGVMVGTTQFTNAFVERRGLVEVGVIRIALPATRALPPMIDWPDDIAAAVGRHHYLVGGGYQFDGRPIADLDEAAILNAARDMKRKGLRAVAVSGVFSPVNADMEERAAAIIRNEIRDVAVTMSSSIGRIGLLERENAAIMNASLAELSTHVMASFRAALEELRIEAPFHISQNDGTLMSADFAEKYPVLAFASGPTNSMRGAAYLSGLKDALVADVGGTTTDIGMLVSGFPRESSVIVDVGGVRTNFRMPDILVLGLGGGSHVKRNGVIKVGPQSVGFRLTEFARVFGGNQLTTTDVAVAAGYADIGDRGRVSDLSAELVNETIECIHRMIEEGVDRMKTSHQPVPLVLVGGGAVLINRDIAGASEVVVPPHASVANAIGASIAHVGGEVDKLYSYEDWGREGALDEAKQEAVELAVAAGALRETVEIVDVEELPLSYIPGKTVRLRVKAAGSLETC
jgi:N-methylhydantoinase A/oxoprolinase/acetone carboxylase beta subunit